MRWIALVAFLFGANLSGYAQDKLTGFESPEKAFCAYLAGIVSQDFDVMLSSLTPEAKAYHIGLAVVSVPCLFEKKEMQMLFADHGIDTSPGDGQAKGKTDEKAAEKAFVDSMLKVKNPGKLMRQLADRAERIAKQLANPDDAAPKLKTQTPKELLSSVKLGKVTITGASAVATATVADAAKNVFCAMPEKIQFRRINGRWYCDIDPR
jgi:hypothetical protein